MGILFSIVLNRHGLNQDRRINAGGSNQTQDSEGEGGFQTALEYF